MKTVIAEFLKDGFQFLVVFFDRIISNDDIIQVRGDSFQSSSKSNQLLLKDTQRRLYPERQVIATKKSTMGVGCKEISQNSSAHV